MPRTKSSLVRFPDHLYGLSREFLAFRSELSWTHFQVCCKNRLHSHLRLACASPGDNSTIDVKAHLPHQNHLEVESQTVSSELAPFFNADSDGHR